MDAVKKLETRFAAVFKGWPALPAGSKDLVVNLWPWFALVLGILRIFAAWSLWDLTRVATRLLDYSSYYTINPFSLSSADRMFIYLGIVVLIGQAILLLTAFPELQKRTARGWDLVFLVFLLNLAYAVISLFIPDYGASSFIFVVITSIFGLYLLFQIRPKYKKVKSKTPKKA